MDKEKLKVALYNAIILLSDSLDTYVDNEDFVQYVCQEIGISRGDYEKIMQIEEEEVFA